MSQDRNNEDLGILRSYHGIGCSCQIKEQWKHRHQASSNQCSCLFMIRRLRISDKERGFEFI